MRNSRTIQNKTLLEQKFTRIIHDPIRLEIGAPVVIAPIKAVRLG